MIVNRIIINFDYYYHYFQNGLWATTATNDLLSSVLVITHGGKL